ncbi:MAG: hypothetical protein HZR80_18995 [Candidatus Heimdallarchaeota archaeon]
MSRKIPTGSTKGRRIEFTSEEETKDMIKGKYEIHIGKRSAKSSSYYPDVKKIIEKYSYDEDKYYFYVSINELNDDLKNLLSIARWWKAFKLFINGNNIERKDVHLIYKILYCEFKSDCEGICFHPISTMYKGERSEYSVYKLIKKLKEIHDEGWNLEYYLRNKRWSKKSENEKEKKYQINKSLLIEEIQGSYSLVDDYCDIYDFEKMKKELDSIKTKFSFPKYFSENVEYETDNNMEDNDLSQENGKFQIKQQVLFLPEEQIDLLAKKIGKEMEKVLKKLMKDKE